LACRKCKSGPTPPKSLYGIGVIVDREKAWEFPFGFNNLRN
jgi:hypothetical protein